MDFYPSPTCRNVVLDIQTVPLDPSIPSGALSASRNRVASISMLIDDGYSISEVSLVTLDERSLVKQFWAEVRECDRFIGWNSLEFDLSFVRQRSWIVGVKFAGDTDLRRLYSHEFVEILHLWSGYEIQSRTRFEGLADVLGTGRRNGRRIQITDWWMAGDLDSIAAQCRDDVRTTYKGFLHLTNQPSPIRYRQLTLATAELGNPDPSSTAKTDRSTLPD